MANQVMKVKREIVAACMTCPLCNKLLKDANTISECLHTFCRKCIYDKITEEEIESCPICGIDLGCAPLEKLRPDHTLQDVRSKIFPLKRSKVRASGPEPEVAPVALPSKRKERSLSSLVVNTPKISTMATTTGRRTTPFATKPSLQSSGFSVKKEENSDDCRSSLPEKLNKSTRNKGQSSSSAERIQPTPDKENGKEEPCETKSDMWKPLNVLLEVANRTKPFRMYSHESDSISESKHGADNEGLANKTKFKNKFQPKVETEKNGMDQVSSDTLEPTKSHRIRQKKGGGMGDFGISPQSVLDAGNAKYEKRNGPVWFCLMAGEEQEGDAPLPQIKEKYLRINDHMHFDIYASLFQTADWEYDLQAVSVEMDGNAPVSSVQKYLMMKLNLTSHNEVEIKCMGQTVVPTLPLCSLIDMWLQTVSVPERVSATIGSSAQEFVMPIWTQAREENNQNSSKKALGLTV
ncbi:hypothetical protein ACFE04_031607 [Oxalis oulophora]